MSNNHEAVNVFITCIQQWLDDNDNGLSLKQASSILGEVKFTYNEWANLFLTTQFSNEHIKTFMNLLKENCTHPVEEFKRYLQNNATQEQMNNIRRILDYV